VRDPTYGPHALLFVLVGCALQKKKKKKCVRTSQVQVVAHFACATEQIPDHIKTLVRVDNPFSDPDILDSPAH
jgi:hypothetical protein